MEILDIRVVLFIVATVSIVINVVQSYFNVKLTSREKYRTENKSRLLEWAAQAAIEDFKQDIKDDSEKELSMSSYVCFYYLLFNKLEENSGIATRKELMKINQYAELVAEVAGMQKDIRKKNTLIPDRNVS